MVKLMRVSIQDANRECDVIYCGILTKPKVSILWSEAMIPNVQIVSDLNSGSKKSVEVLSIC